MRRSRELAKQGYSLPVKVITEPAELKPLYGCSLVPTMGALHAGHLSLIERARQTDRPVVVSVFVNPTQFDDPSDLTQYPRELESDINKAENAGADVVFAPTVEVMYPPTEIVPVPTLPAVATEPELEDRCRPGHFAGVCQVVARLFDLTQPSVAVFGEKDYQQLRVVEAMVAHQQRHASRWPGLTILPEATVRESDGLAMSSRNARLSPDEREKALGLSRALASAKRLAAPGYPARRIEEAMRAVVVRHLLEIEYAVVRDAKTLKPIENLPIEEPFHSRALIAARAGEVRLIDNAAL